MKKHTLCLVVSLVFFGIPSLDATASEECAIVTDLSGTVTALRNGEKMPLDIGHALFVGDEILLAQGSTLIAVTYDDCTEWRWRGEGAVSVVKRGFLTKGRVLKPSRTLPVCYSPESYGGADSNIIGGLVLRGDPFDPVASLRAEFAAGTASNSTLITLVLHESGKRDMEQAQKYFDELQRRNPESEFVKVLKEELEKKQEVRP